MATYYVDFVNGLDANNGLGPDASHASNKPWKTITKLLGAAGMASGDTAYLSPAGPFRETVTVAMTSAVAETSIFGDPGNAQGFKTSGGVLVSPGEVFFSAYTTNDKTNPAAATLLTLSGRDFLTFERITFVGGSASPTCISATTATSINCTFRYCTFIIGRSATTMAWTNAADIAFNLTIDRCIFWQLGTVACITITGNTSAAADYDLNVQITNCILFGGVGAQGVLIQPAGAGAFKAGGVDVYNCLILFTNQAVLCNGANLSTSIPCTVYNSIMHSSSSVVQATTLGQLLEDYNYLIWSTPRTNVAVGANSQVAGANVILPYALLLSYGQELVAVGRFARPFLSHLESSPFLGFGNQAGGPSVDILSAGRPAGGASALKAIGPYERGDSWRRETTTVRTGANALSVTGPGYQDFLVPVAVVSTTVTVYLRKDATYAGTAPKLQVLAQPEIGVSAAEDTLGAAADTWEQQSLNFTPTAAGVVTIRLLSTDTNGGGKAFADDFDVV